jgi:hypothetical protein
MALSRERARELVEVTGLAAMAMGFAIFLFIVYSVVVETPLLELPPGELVYVLIAIALGSLILALIPFGLSLAPLLLEYFWHGVPFGQFSAGAILLTVLSLIASAIFYMVLYRAGLIFGPES